MEINGRISNLDKSVILKGIRGSNNVAEAGFSEKRMASKLFNDFADIRNENKDFNTRLINNNSRLSAYEEQMSLNQYMDEKSGALETALTQGRVSEFNKIITEASYNGTNPIEAYFVDREGLVSGLNNLKSDVETNYNRLKKEFMAIEITSQNLVSLNTYSTEIDAVSLNNSNIYKSDALSNKRVMDLIS